MNTTLITTKATITFKARFASLPIHLFALSKRTALGPNSFHQNHLLANTITNSAAMSKSVLVSGAGQKDVNGVYTQRPPSLIPAGFARTCDEMGWPSESMWQRLASPTRAWYEMPNEAYMYWNKGDGKWWIDVPSGAGAYIVENDGEDPPAGGWVALPNIPSPHPIVKVKEGGEL